MQTKRHALMALIVDMHWADVPKLIKKKVLEESDPDVKANELNRHVNAIDLRKNTLVFTYALEGKQSKTFSVSNNSDAISLYKEYEPLKDKAEAGALPTTSTLEMVQAAEAAKQKHAAGRSYSKIEHAVSDFVDLRTQFEDIFEVDGVYKALVNGKPIPKEKLELKDDLKEAEAVADKASTFLARLKGVKSLARPVEVAAPPEHAAEQVFGIPSRMQKMTGKEIQTTAGEFLTFCKAWPRIRKTIVPLSQTMTDNTKLTNEFYGLEAKISEHGFEEIDRDFDKLSAGYTEIQQTCEKVLKEIATWETSVQKELQPLKRRIQIELRVYFNIKARIIQLRDGGYTKWRLQHTDTPEGALEIHKEQLDLARTAIEYASKCLEVSKDVHGALSDKKGKSLNTFVNEDRSHLATCCTKAFTCSTNIYLLLDKYPDLGSQSLRDQAVDDLIGYADMALECQKAVNGELNYLQRQAKVAAKAHESVYEKHYEAWKKLLDGVSTNETNSTYLDGINRRIAILQKAVAHSAKAIPCWESLPQPDVLSLAKAFYRHIDTLLILHKECRNAADGWYRKLIEAWKADPDMDGGESIIDAQGKAIEQARAYLGEAQKTFAAAREKAKNALHENGTEARTKEIARSRNGLHACNIAYRTQHLVMLRERAEKATDNQVRMDSLDKVQHLCKEFLPESQEAIDYSKNQFVRYKDAPYKTDYRSSLLADTGLSAERVLALSRQAASTMPSWGSSLRDYSTVANAILEQVNDTTNTYVSYLYAESPSKRQNRDTKRAMSDFAARFEEIAGELEWLQKECSGTRTTALTGDFKMLQKQLKYMQDCLSRTIMHIETFVSLLDDQPETTGKEQTNEPLAHRTIGNHTVLKVPFDGYIAGRMLRDDLFERIDRHGRRTDLYTRDKDGWTKVVTDTADDKVDAIEANREQPELMKKQMRRKMDKANQFKAEGNHKIDAANALANLERSPEAIFKIFKEADGYYDEAISNYRWVAERYTGQTSQAQEERAQSLMEDLISHRQTCRNNAVERVIDVIKARAHVDAKRPVLKNFDLRFLIDHDQVQNVLCWCEESKWRDPNSPTADFISDPHTGQPRKTWIRKYAFDIKTGKNGECAKFVVHLHFENEEDARTRPGTFVSGHLKLSQQENFGLLAKREGIRIYRADLDDATRQALDAMASLNT